MGLKYLGQQFSLTDLTFVINAPIMKQNIKKTTCLKKNDFWLKSFHIYFFKSLEYSSLSVVKSGLCPFPAEQIYWREFFEIKGVIS